MSSRPPTMPCSSASVFPSISDFPREHILTRHSGTARWSGRQRSVCPCPLPVLVQFSVWTNRRCPRAKTSSSSSVFLTRTATVIIPRYIRANGNCSSPTTAGMLRWRSPFSKGSPNIPYRILYGMNITSTSRSMIVVSV